MTPDIETLEHQLSLVDDQEDFEHRRHLLAIAECHASRRRLTRQLVDAREQRRLLELNERHTVGTGMSPIRDNLLPRAPRAPGRPRMSPGKTTINPHRVTQALKSRGIRIKDWAEAHNSDKDPVTRSRVMGWVAAPTIEKDGKIAKNPKFKRIRMKFALIFAAEFPECPADLTTWPGGILQNGEDQWKTRAWHRKPSISPLTPAP